MSSARHPVLRGDESSDTFFLTGVTKNSPSRHKSEGTHTLLSVSVVPPIFRQDRLSALIQADNAAKAGRIGATRRWCSVRQVWDDSSCHPSLLRPSGGPTVLVIVLPANATTLHKTCQDVSKQNLLHMTIYGLISITSSEATAASTSALTSRADSDFSILESFGLVTGCFGRNTVQQSS